MKNLGLTTARIIIQAVLSEARRLEMQPLTVIVLDSGGHLIALEREDGSAYLRVEVARGKAFGAIGLGMGSRALMARAETQPWFIDCVNGAAGGALVPVPGGVLVRNEGAELVGAVGVSGDSSDNDERVAVAGIVAAGLQPDGG
jgi:uncharacterized protein GlcG (DUF336 family)